MVWPGGECVSIYCVVVASTTINWVMLLASGGPLPHKSNRPFYGRFSDSTAQWRTVAPATSSESIVIHNRDKLIL